MDDLTLVSLTRQKMIHIGLGGKEHIYSKKYFKMELKKYLL